MPLLDHHQLEASPVVANCSMNRQRWLEGRGGYEAELRFCVVAFLEQRARERGHAAWLDLCCGEGRALLDAAQRFTGAGLDVTFHGVDLVAMFAPIPPGLPGLSLIQDSLHHWEAPQRYDLVTCVHGLHYLGDKLGLLARACGWLVEDGELLAHLDLDNLALRDGGSASRRVPRALRDAGLRYERRMVRCRGHRHPRLPFAYIGADDRAGPNYTRQPAVRSVYRAAP